MRRLLFIVSLIILFASCERTTEPIEYEGDPVFELKGTVASEDLEIFAGKEDYYMYTYYTQNEEGLYSFVGDLRKKEGEGHAFRFILNDSELSDPGAKSKVEESLLEQDYPFIKPPEMVEFIRFGLQPDEWHADPSDQLSYEWSDMKGRLSTSREAEFFYRKESFRPTQICLEVTNETKDVRRTACNVVYYQNDCDAEFEYSNFSSYFSFNVKNPDPSAYYLWVFSSSGGAPPKEGPNVTAEYMPLVMDEVCLSTQKGAECGKIWCKNIIIDSSAVVSLANMKYDVQDVLLEAERGLPFGEFELQYDSPDGTHYSSQLGLQGPDSEFRIMDVSDFDDNENGDPTLKLRISVTCNLFSEAGDVVHVEDLRGSIAIAHP